MYAKSKIHQSSPVVHKPGHILAENDILDILLTV